MQLFIAFFIKLRRGEARIRTGKQRQQAVTENMGTVAEIKASVEQRVGTGEVKQRARKVVAQRRLRSGAVVRGTAVAYHLPEKHPVCNTEAPVSASQESAARVRAGSSGRLPALARQHACPNRAGEALMEP